MIKRILIIGVCLVNVMLHTCVANELNKYTKTTMVFNHKSITFTTLKHDSKKINLLKPQIQKIIEDIENTYSINYPSSSTSQFNKNHQVATSKEYIQLFQKSYEIFNNTKGSYNPTDYTYEEYWSKLALSQISKNDSNQLDSLYKYNIFSGFMTGDSIFYEDTFHLLLMDDFIFKISFENILPGYTFSKILNLIKAKNISDYTIEMNDQVFFAKSFINSKYYLYYSSESPNEFSLNYSQNFNFNKLYFTLLKQSNVVRIWCKDPIRACAYASALCNYKDKTNHKYWDGLLHFETEFK